MVSELKRFKSITFQALGMMSKMKPYEFGKSKAAHKAKCETASAISEDYLKAGYGKGVIGFGTKPGIVVIDYQKAFTTSKGAIGNTELMQKAVEHTGSLLTAARKKGIQIFYTAVAFRPDRKDLGLYRYKMADVLRDATVGTWGVEIDDRVKMEESDILFYKKCPSAFNGTSLQAYLTNMGIDTLIVTGCLTSACVRATVYDAFSAGFRTIVPYECVGDIVRCAHEQNLADVHKRYADVVPLRIVLRYIQRLPSFL